jgi:hypothetical protein
MAETAQHEAAPDGWPEPWRQVPMLAPEPEPDGATELHCPCPLAGLRCGDCVMIAFAPPPFKATPLGWSLATARRAGWRAREILFGPPTDTGD